MTSRMSGELRPKKEVIGTAPAMRAIPLTLEKMPFACKVRRSKRVVDVGDGDVVCVAMGENLSCCCFAVLTIRLKYLPVPVKPLPNAASFPLTGPRELEIPLPRLTTPGLARPLFTATLRASSPNVLGHELCRCRLPVVQGALRDGGTKPLERFLSDGVRAAMLCAAAVRLDPCHVGEIERVIMPPFVRGAEISFLPGFQAGDALAEQGFEFDGPFDDVILCVALGQERRQLIREHLRGDGGREDGEQECKEGKGEARSQEDHQHDLSGEQQGRAEGEVERAEHVGQE